MTSGNLTYHYNESSRSLRKHFLWLAVLTMTLAASVGGWAATFSLSSAVIASGTVVVENNVKKVQHLTGGIVSQLLVREGQGVKRGDLLVKLDRRAATADLSIIESTLSQLYVRQARLKAERIGAGSFEIVQDLTQFISQATAGRLAQEEQKYFNDRNTSLSTMKDQLSSRETQFADEIKGLDVQIEAFKQSLDLIDEELESIRDLYAKKLVTLQRLNSLKRQKAQISASIGERVAARAQTEGKIKEIGLQISQLDEDRRRDISKELTDAEARIAEYEERRSSALAKMDRLDITAPSDGRVLQLGVHTVGGIINAGETIMLVVPEGDDLTVEAKITTSDIDKIRLGQPVEIRFSAFDQRTTPEVAGEVVGLAPDVVRDQVTGSFYYPLRIRPQVDSLKKLKGLTLYPGMPAEVFVKIADRSVVSYFIKPLTDQMTRALRED